MKYFNKAGTLYSVYPPTDHLTFGSWIYLVPQYRPKNVLILGYAGGTVAGLIRLLYQNVAISAVDIEPCDNRYGVTFIQTDAKEYVKSCGEFDTVIVDLFVNDKIDTVCDFILTKEFVGDLGKIANYVIVNTLGDVDMSAYNVFENLTWIKPPGLSNKIYYYKVKNIPELFI